MPLTWCGFTFYIMAKQNKEHELCKAITGYLKAQYPKAYFHFDLAGLNLSMAQAGMQKAITCKRGYPDLFITEPRNGYAGMYIEVKAVNIYKKDGVTLLANDHIWEQRDMLALLRGKGYYAEFGIGFDECKAMIDAYLGK